MRTISLMLCLLSLSAFAEAPKWERPKGAPYSAVWFIAKNKVTRTTSGDYSIPAYSEKALAETPRRAAISAKEVFDIIYNCKAWKIDVLSGGKVPEAFIHPSADSALEEMLTGLCEGQP